MIKEVYNRIGLLNCMCCTKLLRLHYLEARYPYNSRLYQCKSTLPDKSRTVENI